MVSLNPSSMVFHRITQRSNVEIVILLAVFVVDNFPQGHLRFILYSVTVLVHDNGDVQVLGVNLPAVNEQVTKTPGDFLMSQSNSHND